MSTSNDYLLLAFSLTGVGIGLGAGAAWAAENVVAGFVVGGIFGFVASVVLSIGIVAKGVEVGSRAGTRQKPATHGG